MKKTIIILFIIIFLSNCKDKIAGTLGGGNVYEFNCSEEKLNKCLDSFYKKTKKLKIPKKWVEYNNWDEKGYGFLNGKVFYIKNDSGYKEEMYYVSVWSDSITSAESYVAVRSVFRMFGDTPRWLYFEDISEPDALKIEYNFNKIILKNLILDCNCSTYKLNSNYLNEP
jgi:hypothetical protein